MLLAALAVRAGWAPADVSFVMGSLTANLVVIIKLFTDKNGGKLDALIARVDALERRIK